MLTILKIGGALLEDKHVRKQCLTSIAQYSNQKILVHGGGRTASSWMKKLGMKPQMHEGRRITDSDTLEVITMVYSGENKKIVAELQLLGQNAVGLTGADENCIIATKRPATPIDFGWVGDIEPDSVNSKVFLGYVNHDILPVVAPLTYDQNGHLLNTNADTMASVIASSMQKQGCQLIYLFEKNGVLENVEDEDSLIPRISFSDFIQMKKEKTIHSGMIPKLQNGFDALNNGVNRVIICHPKHLLTEKKYTELTL